MATEFNVVVGNVGTVHTGDEREKAEYEFNSYVQRSACPGGRACGEPVTLFENGEPIREYNPPETPIDLFDISMSDVVSMQAITPAGTEWVYPSFLVDTHHPADRCGMPYAINDIARDSWGQRAFLFAIVDSHFPTYHLALGDSFQDAHEWFVDSKEERFKIDECDLGDYPEEDRQYSSNGVPVDTSSVQGGEVTLIEYVECTQSIEGIREMIVEHFGKALFACAWIDNEEEQGRHYPGQEVFEIMPDTIPQSALDKAEKTVRRIEFDNAKWEIGIHFAATVMKGDYPILESEITDFGHYLGMECLGHGVAWEDNYDRSPHGLRLPNIEFHASDVTELDMATGKVRE